MVGGKVVETIVLEDSVWVDVAGTRGEAGSTCAIRVELCDKARCISEGDSLWWQGCSAYWTPSFAVSAGGGRGGVDYDIEIRRIGCSGAPRPDQLVAPDR